MNWRRFNTPRGRGLLATGLILTSAVALWLFWGNRGSNAPALSDVRVGSPVSVDRPAPAFARPLLSGNGSLSLSQYRGKVVVVNFWASTCPACRSEGPQLESLWRAYRGQGVRFLGVDYVDDAGAGSRFARSLGITYPSVTDPNGRVGNDFRVVALPTTFIIGPDSRIRYTVLGRIHSGSFRVALDAVVRRAASSATDP